MIYQVIPYQQVHFKAWNTFVSQAQNATFLHDRNFMDYHKHRFNESSLVVFKEEKIVALLPANKVDTTVYSHNGLSYGGLIINENTKLKEVVFIFRALLHFLNENNVEKLIIKEIPLIYNTQPSDFLTYLSYVLKATCIKTEILSVVNKSFQPIKTSKQRLRGLKKAKKQQLVIKETTSFTSFFDDILIPNLHREHQVKPVHSVKEMDLLKQRFPEHIRQFNVYKDDVLVAGATIFETKTVAHAQYIASNENRQDLGSLDFLFHYLIETEYSSKPYFDFGTSNETNGLQINSGLLYFKESFGARTIAQQSLQFDTVNYNLLDTVFI